MSCTMISVVPVSLTSGSSCARSDSGVPEICGGSTPSRIVLGCYLLRDGRMSRVSHDHTLVQSMVEAAKLTEAEAASHLRRSVLLRGVGAGVDVVPGLARHTVLERGNANLWIFLVARFVTRNGGSRRRTVGTVNPLTCREGLRARSVVDDTFSRNAYV